MTAPQMSGWKWVPFLALTLVLSACTAGKSGVSSSGSGAKLRVFYNNDNFGYLEPCGCRVSPIGGMDRRWNAMKAFPEETRIFVDAGNMLFKSTQASDFLAPQWYEQAAGVIEAYNILGADAATVGENEFALGLSKFEELKRKANFTYVSANLVRRSTGKLFLQDSVIIERMGKKIGVFGVTHPALRLPEELEAMDPVEAARNMVAQLRSKGADMVIALANQGYERDLELAKKVSGIDLLVGAHTQSLLQSPVNVGDTLIVQLSNQGQMLGMVEYEAASLPAKRTEFVVDELNDEYNKSPNGLANPMKNLLAVTNLRMGEANRKLDERIWAAHEGQGVGGYETFISCRECHSKQTKFQEGQLHSAAFLTLVARGKEMNLDCVKCHSVGMGAPDGFRTLADAFRNAEGQAIPYDHVKKATAFVKPDTVYRGHPEKIRPDVARWIDNLKSAGVKKAFVSVQCENCHGPKPGHPFANEGVSAKVNSGLCLQCHTKEQMPAWYDEAGKVKQATVNAALQSIACPR